MFFNPLEQFQIYPLLTWNGFFLTNSSFILITSLLGSLILFDIIFFSNKQIFFFPKNWQIFIEGIYLILLSILINNVGKKGQKFFPFIFILFSFIIISNLSGLITYSFTVTSHLIITVGLSILVFIGVNIICFKKHNNNMLVLFMPSGISLELAFILVPIEIISYVFKPLSLSVRLFANMMAGHTLLKVIAMFIWTITENEILNFIHIPYIPMILLIVILCLELAVGIIQAYVFTLLICIYLNDAINLH